MLILMLIYVSELCPCAVLFKNNRLTAGPATRNEYTKNKKYEKPSPTNEITVITTKLLKPLIYIKQIVTHGTVSRHRRR